MTTKRYRYPSRYRSRHRDTARSWGNPLTDEQRAAAWAATQERIYSSIQRARQQERPTQTVRSA